MTILVMLLSAIAVPNVGADEEAPPQTSEPSPATDGRAIVRNWDIQVSFEFGPTKNQLYDVIAGLQRGSRILYDASEGQFRWNHAEVWTHRKNFDSPDTDFQILDVGIHYRANAVRGGIDLPGGIIHLGKTHFGMLWDSDWGAMCMAHEWGHYALYLPDEYVDVQQGQYIVSVPWCQQCLMSNASDIDRDTEYCTLDNHNYTNPNAEPAGSCWEQIKAHYPTVDMPTTNASIIQDGPTYPESEDMTYTIHYPDLYIESDDIIMTPPNPKEGEEVSITARIHNKDEILYGDVIEVRFYDGPIVDGDKIGTKSIALSGNENDTISIDWVAEGGTHDILVDIDHNNQVPEWEEYTNNTATKIFVIPSKPVISEDMPDTFTADEDVPMVLSLKTYETDLESADAGLTWTVPDYDDTAVSSIEGEGDASDTVTITPVEDWFGTTYATFRLTDEDELFDEKTVALTWEAVNDAPTAGAITLERDWVYRTTAVEVTFDGSDVEDQVSTLTPEMDFTHENESDWEAIDPELTVAGFTAELVPDAEATLGLYDVRARLRDGGGIYGDYSYLNSTLLVRNYPPTVTEKDPSGDTAYRAEPLDIDIEGYDMEDEGSDLEVEVQYKPKDDDTWYDAGTFDHVTGNYDEENGRWTVPLVVGTDAPKTRCDVRMRLIDLDGPGEWAYINNSITVRNSRPTVTNFTADEDSVLRTESVILTILGFDRESDDSKLELTLEYTLGSSSTWRPMDPHDIDVEYKASIGGWEVTFTPPDDVDTGKYRLRATLKDTEGDVGDPTEMEGTLEVENNLPTVIIECNDHAEAGEVVQFDGRDSSDIEDSTGLTYEWDFGDRSKSTKSRASHSYSRAGKYTVKLTVTDRDGGSTTEEMTMYISEGSGPGSIGGVDLALVGAIIGVVVAVVVVVLILFMRKKGIGPFG